MKKILSILFLLAITLSGVSQVAIKKSQDTCNQSLRAIKLKNDSVATRSEAIRNTLETTYLKINSIAGLETSISNTLTEISLRDEVLTYTCSAVSSNTGVAMGTGSVIGNNTLTVASNFSLSIPNGSYILENAYYSWGSPSGTSCGVLHFIAFNTTVTATNDNSALNLTLNDWLDKFLFSIYFQGSYLNSLNLPFQPGIINGVTATSRYANYAIFKVTNNIIYFNLITASPCTPSSGAGYKFILRVKRTK